LELLQLFAEGHSSFGYCAVTIILSGKEIKRYDITSKPRIILHS
jgi:hypothetical protein